MRVGEKPPQALLATDYRGQEGSEKGTEQERGYSVSAEKETRDQGNSGRGTRADRAQ